jgi:hypothetical protein
MNATPRLLSGAMILFAVVLAVLSHQQMVTALVIPTTTTSNRCRNFPSTYCNRKTPSSSSALYERKWNFNSDGRNPWGVKRNAEVWNGRVAQMAFTVVLLQELLQGKGVIQGIQEGNVVNLVIAGGAILSMVALTIFLAVQASQYEEFKVPPPLGTQWQTREGDEEHILD